MLFTNTNTNTNTNNTKFIKRRNAVKRLQRRWVLPTNCRMSMQIQTCAFETDLRTAFRFFEVHIDDIVRNSNYTVQILRRPVTTFDSSAIEPQCIAFASPCSKAITKPV